jgi:iron-sulfur cluster assembly accessory protein
MAITLTEKAVNKIIEIIFIQLPKEKDEILGLRVQIVGGGCRGFTYHMIFEKPGGDSRFLMDKVFEFEGRRPDGENYKLKVFVDPASMLYIDGTVIDYVDTLEGSGFKFDNPNADTKCGCGQSFSA